MRDWNEVVRYVEAQKYKGLAGKTFLKAYFIDHGITDQEIDLVEKWGWGVNNTNLVPDEDGMKYAQKRTEKIKAYRNITLEQIEKNIGEYPWEWRTVKSFQRIWDPWFVPKNNDSVHGVYSCYYKGKDYYFGIGREEVPITEEMRQKGEWYVYTWAD